MSGLILLPGKQRQQQPQYNAPIDLEGLGKGIRFLLNPALGPIDLATGRVWEANGDAKTEGVTRGKILRLDGTGDYYTHTGYPEITSNVGTFFVWCPTVGANVGLNGHALLATTSPSASYHLIDASRFLHFGGVQGGGTTLSSWYNSTNRSLVMSSDGTAARTKAYLDGADSGITWGSAPGAWGAGAKNFRLGGYPAGSQWDFAGSIRIVGYTDEVWGAAEGDAFHKNPWTIFKALVRRLYPVSSGGTTHDLTVSNASQANTASTATISQAHALTVSAATSANTSSTPAITQAHILAASNSIQDNAASDVAVTIGASVTLVAAASVQGNSASTAPITQTHVLIHAPSVQDNIAASSAIVQAHILAAANSLQGNVAGTGAISLLSENNLTAAPVTQGNIAGTGQITRTQTLTVASATQGNKLSAGAISDGVVVEAALTTGIVPADKIKKPGIPVDAPAWLKTFLETIVGRRGNKIAPPAFQDLQFSATPTQAECEALYHYVNQVRTSVADILTRLDS